MYEYILNLTCSDFFNLKSTCYIHGWINLEPFSWNKDQNSLHFCMFAGQAPINISITQSDNSISATIQSADKLFEPDLKIAENAVRRCTGIDENVDNLYKVARRSGSRYEKQVKQGFCRLLRSPALWEDAAKTLFTTNCSWSQTQRMCQVMCSDRFSEPTTSGAFPFPKPETISKLSIQQIKDMIPVGYRAKYLKALAERFFDDPLLNGIENNNDQEAIRIALSLDGFGNYAASHLMVLCGYFNEIPIDSVVTEYVKKYHNAEKIDSFISEKYDKWGKFKWWGLKYDRILDSKNWIGD